MSIKGNKFLVQFGMAKAMLRFDSDVSLTFTITEKNGEPQDITETVAIKMTELRPGLFLITWQEASGTTVTQVHDYENKIIYLNWTSPDGEFTNLKGTITQI